ARPGFTVVLVGSDAPSAVVIGCGAGSPHDSAALLRRLTDKFGGKGGGRPELAQGGGLQGNPQDIVAFAKSILPTPTFAT
ncbi:MAG: DHHA1 domain-containing protein, partial [Vicinamibacterales bacterium]